MKPILLEFCGINSFSEPAKIDFNALTSLGIFGVFGDTGSGKSTILDCIGFALYGNVARSRSGSIADVINYNSDKAYVHFEFEITFEGKRRVFYVERELKRKNAAQSARVYEKSEKGTTAIADGVRDCNALLERVIGLEQKDFEKCIALPQGEFAQFVKAARSERLKLVSRLFDLEEYGERLVKKCNARFGELKNECNILSARLEQYEDVTDKGNKELKMQISRLEKQAEQLRVQLAAVREEEKRFSALAEKKREYDEVQKRFSVLEEQREEMEVLAGEISRLGAAAAVLKAEEEYVACQNAYAAAEQSFRAATTRKQKAEIAQTAANAWKEETTDAQISLLTETRALSAEAEKIAQKQKSVQEALVSARRAYAEEAKKFEGFSYRSEQEKLEQAFAATGSGDFWVFASENAASLFRNEYAVFANEVDSLTEKYPVIAPDGKPLSQKYRRLAAEEKTDFAQIRADYERREQKRAEIVKKQVELEKYNGAYTAHLERLQQLQTEGLRLKTELEELQSQLKSAPPLSQVERELNQKKAEKQQKRLERERTQTEFLTAQTLLATAEEKLWGARENIENAKLRTATSLKEGLFENVAAAQALVKKYGNAEEAHRRLEDHQTQFAAVSARRKTLLQIDFSAVTEERLSEVKKQVETCEQSERQCGEQLALLRSQYEKNITAYAAKCALQEDYARIKGQAELYERLKQLFEGNRFMEYVAEEYLQNVAENAGGRLLSLTDGRYFLRYDGGFFVGDNYNGGALRAVYTLSGGETFLVSLSLALALSGEICARSMRPIEFFFLDEGFGTLDERLVDTVMDSLEKLKGEHFSIGIISHVEELKHRIEKKITVTKATERHGSQIHAE